METTLKSFSSTMSNPTLKPASFSLETIGDRIFYGYSEAKPWNGWEQPYFSFETAQQVVDAFNEILTAYYNFGTDSFLFQLEDDDDLESYSGIFVEGIGKLYPIGAGSWIWEKVSEVAE